MYNRNKQNKIFIIIASLTLISCDVQKYQQPGMAVKGQLYRDTITTDTVVADTLSAVNTSSIASLPYSQLFTDTVLQNLIAEGIRENLNLKTAVQRINEA